MNHSTIPPSIFNAYHICHRQAWLMHHQLTADQQNTFLDIGRLIDDTTYEREKKKIYLADISAMVDMVTKKDGNFFIAEIKKSSKRMDNAVLQLKYYLYLLRKKSVFAKGMLKIPKEKKNVEIDLSDEDIQFIQESLTDIDITINKNTPPDIINKSICSRCAHYEFCWA